MAMAGGGRGGGVTGADNCERETKSSAQAQYTLQFSEYVIVIFILKF